ncbi:hemolysin III [Actinokineospora alba]|uniref:Hemolysin III n=1 Tax=Actinokineospora alba TaxID=504798 RepID=A0A1H0RUS4_9PSEU|nr:hemolysin III family protein [Actinokineospora alba]TDP66924.1 channel protein (hemolysin III family) [Actinokineospora alba]SDJ33934.1 hemolysin III [Actinokineospora alba]SDP32726.1 hemolysin III [Actinokineospora alba]
MTEPDRPTKPRMRGVIHFWSFIVSVVTGATLIALAASTVSGVAALATSVYVITVLGLFGVSALYHRRWWVTERARTWMKRLDHSMIFLFIAGTYTPFCLLGMTKPTGYVILGVVWGGALLGVGLKLLWPHAPRWLGTPIYIALGWVAVFVLPELLRSAGVAALVLILIGGAFYTVGAVFYATKWPNPWPGVFGHHEFFHAATVIAALCHYVAIWLVLYS